MTTNRNLTTEERWPRDVFPLGSLIYDSPPPKRKESPQPIEKEDNEDND